MKLQKAVYNETSTNTGAKDLVFILLTATWSSLL